jgi:hypothetical protein
MESSEHGTESCDFRTRELNEQLTKRRFPTITVFLGHSNMTECKEINKYAGIHTCCLNHFKTNINQHGEALLRTYEYSHIKISIKY